MPNEDADDGWAGLAANAEEGSGSIGSKNG